MIARRKNHILTALTATVLVGSIFISLALPLLAYRWAQLPFIGAFVEQTLVFNDVGPHGGVPWAGIRAGLRFPYQLTAVAGQPVHDTAELTDVLAARRPGETVTLTYRSADGVERQTSVTLQTFPVYDLFAYFLVPYLVGLAYLAIGLWVFRARRGEAAGRAFALFCAAIAVVVGGLFDLYTTHVFSWAWTLALPLATGALLILALVFPQRISLVVRYPALRWLGFIPAGMIAAAAEMALYDTHRPAAYAAAWRNEYAFAAAGLLFFLACTHYRRRRAPAAIAREQARIILWGSALAFGPVICFLVLATARLPIIFNVLLYFPPLVIFPLAGGYAILRYRLTIRRLRTLAFLTFLLLGMVSLAAAFWALRQQQPDPLVITLAGRQRMLTQQMRLQVLSVQTEAGPAIRETLHGTAHDYFEKTLQALIAGGEAPFNDGTTATLPPTRNPEILVQLETVRATWGEVHAAIHGVLEDDPQSAAFAEAAAKVERLSPLMLSQIDVAVRMYTAEAEHKAARVMAIQLGFLALAVALLVVAYLASEVHILRPIAQLEAAARRIGGGDLDTPVSAVGLGEIDSLANRFDEMRQNLAASQVELKRQLEELAVLHAVATAGTEAVSEDVLIERATDIIGETLFPDNFGVLLVDAAAGVLRVHPSYRGVRKAVKLLTAAPGQGIAGGVWARGQPWRVPDVSHEPAYRGANANMCSELCVPLKVGARVIGVINAESSRLNAFTEADERLLVTFAGQLATAVEKVRLFKAERAARQQAETLCEAIAALTHTLDINQVLESILIHLERVLPYDSAGVFLVGRAKRQSLRAVAGRGFPNPEQVIDRDFPVDDSLFQEIQRTGRPVILADARADSRFERWGGADYVRGWMGVPLLAGGECIGLLTLDCRQVAVYGKAEATLAQAFADQAAVAIDNARLFEQVYEGRKQMQALSGRLVEVQETERRHIARELHDEIGQTLTGLRLILETSMRSPTDTARASLRKAQGLVEEIMVRVSDLSLDLRPPMLDDLGLLPTLLWHFERHTAQTGVRVRFGHVGLERRFAPEVETAAYRIVQEALTNVARHAGVSEAAVQLWADQDALGVRIEDQGAGFDPEAALAAGASSGLAGMRERAVLLGGQLTVEAAPGAGACLTAELPLGDHPLERRLNERET